MVVFGGGVGANNVVHLTSLEGFGESVTTRRSWTMRTAVEAYRSSGCQARDDHSRMFGVPIMKFRKWKLLSLL